MEKWRAFRNSPRYEDAKGGVVKKGKNLLMTILQIILIVGISYVILSPVIGIVAQSFFSDADSANPMVYTIPIEGTLERYTTVITQMDYFRTLGNTLIYTVALTLIQVLICSMVGYGFARFDFPLKKLLFGCVVLMIVIPNHTIMLPQYMTFRSMGLMSEATPMYILTLFGTGLRAGLFIYIFNQFFRGLPKEIEEAAFVDGAGVWYTYFRIMLRNAMPAVITVAVFSMVWQFNDTFYAKLFLISENVVISKKIATLQAVIANNDKILDLPIQELYLDAGIILVILPILIIYLVLQKYFIEGVERSGIVG